MSFNEKPEGPVTDCKLKGTFMTPVEGISCIDIFAKLVTEDLICLQQTDKNSNLSSDELKAFIWLGQDETLVIKASDKGGNKVVLYRSSYAEICFKISKNI